MVVDDADTVKVAVAPVDASVMVSAPAALPAVNTAVAAVLLLTVGVAILDPVPPVTVKSPAAVSELQMVLVPVRVRAGVVLADPVVGLMVRLGTPTVIVPVKVPSDTVIGPVADVPPGRTVPTLITIVPASYSLPSGIPSNSRTRLLRRIPSYRIPTKRRSLSAIS